MQEYLEAIRSRVCSVCIGGIFDNFGQFVRCGLPEDRTCPVETFLPKVIEVVRSVESPKIEDYVTVLRQKVCTECLQTEDGRCEVRLRADCALDRYFMLVAEAIEEATRKRATAT
ncbi:MAG: hypothetical protein ACE5HO_03755 [bacterium]